MGTRLLRLLALLFVPVAAFATFRALSTDHYEVWPGNVRLPDGSVVQTGTRYSLAEACELAAARQASTGDPQTIRFTGYQPRLGLAVGDGRKKWEAVSPTGFHAITIVGDDATAEIGDVHIAGADEVDDVTFESFTLSPVGGLQAGLIAYAQSWGGLIRLRNVYWQTDARTKWGIRGHGSFGWDLEGCHAPDGGLEHFAYLDNVQGASIVDCTASSWKRTMVQLVVRTFPHFRPSSGDVLLRNLRARDTGEHGGSAFTIAGHVGGTVRIEDCRVVSNHPTGAIVAYLDVKQKELANPKGPKPFVPIGPGYTNGNGRAGDRIIVRNGYFSVDGDRDVIAIGSFDEVEVVVAQLKRAFVAGNKPALDVKHGGQSCGVVRLISRGSPNEWNWQTPANFVEDGVPFDPETVWEASR